MSNIEKPSVLYEACYTPNMLGGKILQIDKYDLLAPIDFKIRTIPMPINKELYMAHISFFGEPILNGSGPTRLSSINELVYTIASAVDSLKQNEITFPMDLKRTDFRQIFIWSMFGEFRKK